MWDKTKRIQKKISCFAISEALRLLWAVQFLVTIKPRMSYMVSHFVNDLAQLRGYIRLLPGPQGRRDFPSFTRDVVIFFEDSPVSLRHLWLRFFRPMAVIPFLFCLFLGNVFQTFSTMKESTQSSEQSHTFSLKHTYTTQVNSITFTSVIILSSKSLN